MQGKHVAITGPTAGIGRHTALELAARGAELTLFCRNADKAQSIQQDCAAISGRTPTLILMDMANLTSVRQAADEFLALEKPLDVLLNNAGLVNTSRRQTVDGFEETLAVNHFAPFLLTGLLLPAIQQTPSARIVNVASHAHTFVRDMGFEDMQAERGYRTFREYGRSKLANILFTRSLARRLEGQDITVNCLHPGAVSTSLGHNNPGLLSKALPLLLKPFFRSPEQGAETSIYLCCSDEVAGISGEYFSNCKQAKAKPWARDDAAAEQLWQYSQECTGFRYPV
jgi:NAD(P)-dependent dehydrogenase (short-subunit alcohol dehydrogenase family)